MDNVSMKNVRITGGYWKQKQDLDRKVTIRAVWDRYVETGRIAAFDFAWKPGEDKQPHVFWDSDVAKWMEGAADLIALSPDAGLEAKIEGLIDRIEAHRAPDGYFNIHFTVVKPGERFTNRNCHELYCAGHLIEAAVAYYEATGKDRFLNLMRDYIDLIYKVFVEEKSAKFVTPGHEEIELALLRFYKATGYERSFELAKFFLEKRGEAAELLGTDFDNAFYSQSHKRIREQKEAMGHAVRAGYLYTAMARYAKLTGDKALFDACEALFEDIVKRKAYITGGIGSTNVGEAFTIPYDLPNATAYSETCAAISMILFADAMLENRPDPKYGDLIEREMYNGMISGLSLSGDCFFYENPLEISLSDRTRFTSTVKGERMPITQRQKNFNCSCCPPNLNRMLAQIGKYFYYKTENCYYIEQFAQSEMTDGGAKIRVKTDYPKSGKIRVYCENVKNLRIRIPGWCEKYDAPENAKVADGYLEFTDPEEIKLDFKMNVTLRYANPKILADAGKCAVLRGPVVYCAESVDNAFPLQAIRLTKTTGARLAKIEGFPLPAIDVPAKVAKAGDELYPSKKPEEKESTVRLIPYAFFANRGEADMRVWFNA